VAVVGRHKDTIFDRQFSDPGEQSLDLVVHSFEITMSCEVRLMMSCAPMYVTASGNRPIAVEWIDFCHSLSDDGTEIKYTFVTVAGRPEPGAKWAASRRHPGGIVRRTSKVDDSTPDWLRELSTQTEPKFLMSGLPR
jgi:hypothetical protein